MSVKSISYYKLDKNSFYKAIITHVNLLIFRTGTNQVIYNCYAKCGVMLAYNMTHCAYVIRYVNIIISMR